jgi:hypothetical protein
MYTISPSPTDLKSPEDLTPADYFMLTEYEHLTELLLYTKEVGHTRVQFWLSIVSAVGGLLAVLFQLGGGSQTFFCTLVIACIVLFLIGGTIFRKLIHRTITTVEYLRALGKIKRYFVDKAPEVAKHLYFPARDDRPSFRYDPHMMGSSLRGLVVTINSFIVAALVAVLPILLWASWPKMKMEIILAIAAFGVSYLIHELYAAWRFARAESQSERKIRFRHIDE